MPPTLAGLPTPVLTRVEDISREEAERRVNEWMATEQNHHS
jgi:hypothetical protein